jgi:hypothetical protein
MESKTQLGNEIAKQNLISTVGTSIKPDMGLPVWNPMSVTLRSLWIRTHSCLDVGRSRVCHVVDIALLFASLGVSGLAILPVQAVVDMHPEQCSCSPCGVGRSRLCEGFMDLALFDQIQHRGVARFSGARGAPGIKLHTTMGYNQDHVKSKIPARIHTAHTYKKYLYS